MSLPDSRAAPDCLGDEDVQPATHHGPCTYAIRTPSPGAYFDPVRFATKPPAQGLANQLSAMSTHGYPCLESELASHPAVLIEPAY